MQKERAFIQGIITASANFPSLTILVVFVYFCSMINHFELKWSGNNNIYFCQMCSKALTVGGIRVLCHFRKRLSEAYH